MDKERFIAHQFSDSASCQTELALATDRAKQFEAWEQIALSKLAKANIKNAEIQEEHHQTFLRLRSCLQHIDAIQAHMQATMQARDHDIFWRLANPLRNFIGYVPRPIIVYGRKSLKLLYWLATPWKMKARLQFIRNKNNLQMQQSTEHMRLTTHMLDSDQQISKDNVVLNASSRDLYERIHKSMAKS